MCTIIKVKRKITEDPLECLVLECKKIKTADSDTTLKKPIKQLLKYGGSAQNEEELPAKIQNLSSLKDSPFKLTDTKSDKKLNFTIQNKKRGLTVEDSYNDKKDEENKKVKIIQSETNNINIIDVVINNETKPKTESLKQDQITCNGVNMIREKCDPIDYVYDIYYTKSSNIHLDLLYPNNYEIRSYNMYQDIDLIDDSAQNEDGDPNNVYDDEDEDSNDEDNWRNDYPDEEDDIDDENDDEPFSHRNRDYDDEEYDDYVHGYNDFDNDDEDQYDRKLSAYLKKSMNLDRSYNEDNDSFDEEYDNDEFEEQVNKYGYSKSYADYKKRILKEFKKDYKHIDN